ncbi:MAG: hypothetical protein KDA44_11410 [Planctomycetales bacterium]|nr:hypothetical protein [Planctomycetales bacterium]
MRFFVIGLAALLGLPGDASGAIWINEIHYDNAGTDSGEFVELVVGPGMSISDATLYLYNGDDQQLYNSGSTFSGGSFTLGSMSNGFSIYSLSLPVNGLQNGPSDGLALEVSGSIVQFLSYEGSFTADGGPADGLTSVDIGVAESSSTVVGASLSLIGTGSAYADFTWAVTNVSSAGATPGGVNNGQTLVRPSAGAVPEATSLVVWASLAVGALLVRKRG